MRNHTQNSAVVLGADVNGLGHIRSLGKMGISTYVICSGGKNDNPDSFSKYSVAVHVPNNAQDYKKKLLYTLLELAKRFNTKPVLYATSDYFVDFIASNRSALERHYLFNLPSNTILKLITNKYSTDIAVRNSGLKSPKTIRYADANSLSHVAKSFEFPCIIKPQDSFTCSFPGKNQTVNDMTELAAFIGEHPELMNHIVVQEIIPGNEDNIFQCTVYIGIKRQIQFFTMQKIHQYPPGFGTTSMGRSTTIPPIIENTKNLLIDIGYTGFASVEFKKSAKTNDYYLIEINPRLPWYNSLFDSCGVNFPYLAYLDLTKNNLFPKNIVKQKNNVYWLHMRNEARGLWKRKRAGEAVNIAKYITKALKARSFAYFDWSDLRPFLKASFTFLRMEFSRIFRHKKPMG